MPKKIKPTRPLVEAALAKCIDPELGIDIVSLGLIYDITIETNKITILMTLTTPGCPLVPYFKQQITEHVTKATKTPKVEIVLTFDPPWSPDKISPAVKSHLTMLRG